MCTHHNHYNLLVLILIIDVRKPKYVYIVDTTTYYLFSFAMDINNTKLVVNEINTYMFQTR